MFCVAYRLRHKSEPLPTEAVKRNGVRGEFRYVEQYFDPRPWRKQMVARLLNDAGEDALTMLHQARMVTVKGGLLVAGIEIAPESPGSREMAKHRQTWWCLPVLGDVVEEVAPSPAKDDWRRRSGEEWNQRIRELTMAKEPWRDE